MTDVPTPEQADTLYEQLKRTSGIQANLDSQTLFDTKLYDFATGTVDRARTAGALVLTASSALAGLYAGIVALVYSSGGHAFPLRGVIAPVFLGIAVVLSTANSAFLPQREPAEKLDYVRIGTPTKRAEARRNFFIRYVNNVASRRSWMLRGAVIALAIALTSIVLPFITVPAGSATTGDTSASSWPTAVPTASYPPDQAVILFKAQVDEAVASQATSPKATWIDSWEFTAIYGGVGLLMLAVVCWLTTRRSRGERVAQP